MTTYLEIQNRVNLWCVDLPTEVLNEIPTFVNQAMRELEDDHNFDVMRKRLSANTTAATHTLVSKPSDWKEPRKDRPWFEQQTGQLSFMGWLPTEEEALKLYNLSLTDTGQPRWLRMADATDDDATQNIEVYPLSNSVSDWTSAPVGEYRIRIPYWAYLPELSADGDRNWFTDNAREFLEFWAAGLAFWADQDEERAVTYWNLAGQRGTNSGQRTRVKNLDKRQKLGQMRTLNVRTDVFAPKPQGGTGGVRGPWQWN